MMRKRRGNTATAPEIATDSVAKSVKRKGRILRSLVVALPVLLAVVVLFPSLANAQTIERDCYCGGATCPVVDFTEKVDIRKIPDLAIVDKADDPGKDSPGQTNRANAYVAKVLGALVVAKVNTVQDAIDAIVGYVGPPPGGLNVVILDHASPGSQQIGNESIGVKNAGEIANLNKFIKGTGATGGIGVAGLVSELKLLGCQVAAGPNGQKLLRELKFGIGLDLIKGYTSKTQGQYSLINPKQTYNLYVQPDSKKKKEDVGGIAELAEAAGTPLETVGSGASAGVLAGAIAGAVLVAGVSLGGAAWYTKRRLIK